MQGVVKGSPARGGRGGEGKERLSAMVGNQVESGVCQDGESIAIY